MDRASTDRDRTDRAGTRGNDAIARACGDRPFMVGIGGAGMSALARLLHDSGTPVRGVDAAPGPVTERLVAGGIGVGFDQTAAALPEDADRVVASAAVRADHPILVEALERGVPIVHYPEALGACMGARSGVAIAGTHGKSTTAAMLACALTDAGLDPGAVVGAACAQLTNGALGAPGEPTGSRVGAARIPRGPIGGAPGLLIAEACEFNRSFHNLRPRIASIASIEADHLDIYGSLDAVVEAFAGFARLVPGADDGGVLIIGHDGAHRRQVASGLACAVETIGFNPGADWAVGYDPTTGATSVRDPDGGSFAWSLSMPGEHNAINSAVAFALGVHAGADPGVLAESLGAFSGLERRLQVLGSRGGVRVIDDYGHHPTEIDATLRALRESCDPEHDGGRLVCVFQPHQHSRTRFLLEEFATSFEHADIVIVPEIYFVRDSEAEKGRVSSADLVDRLRSRGVRAMHLHPFGAIIEQLEHICRPGDLLVVMGAGPVWKVGRGFLDAERTS